MDINQAEIIIKALDVKILYNPDTDKGLAKVRIDLGIYTLEELKALVMMMEWHEGINRDKLFKPRREI